MSLEALHKLVTSRADEFGIYVVAREAGCEDLLYAGSDPNHVLVQPYLAPKPYVCNLMDATNWLRIIHEADAKELVSA
jgi:hypothetical protein